MPVEEDEPRGPAILRAPVTSLLAICWVLVFVLLTIARARLGPIPIQTALFGGFISPGLSHGFGDVTPIGLYGGQFWRVLTATCVHFNLLHLTLNLIAFVQLGRVVESWYGSWQFLALYVVLGAGANLASNLLRPWISGPPGLLVHSGGGSTVVLGLIGLVAVVGWRNRSEFPRWAPIWMVAILLANAVLGLIVPNIDNLGHASGAVVGGLMGLLDRRLLRRVNSRRAKLAGAVALLVLVASGWAQVGHRRLERAAAIEELRARSELQLLVRSEVFYRELQARGDGSAFEIEPRPPNLLDLPTLELPRKPGEIQAIRAELIQSIRALDDLDPSINRAPTAEAMRALRVLSSRTRFKLPTQEEVDAFKAAMQPLYRRAVVRVAEAHQRLIGLKQPSPKIAGEALSRLVRRSAPRPPGAGAVPNEPSAPKRNPPSSESGPETR